MRDKEDNFRPWDYKSSSWGKETLRLRNIMAYELRRTNATSNDLMMAYYSMTQSRFWLNRTLFRNKRFRFFLESCLCFLQALDILSRCDTRAEFLARCGLTDSDVDLMGKGYGRSGFYPALAKRFNQPLPVRSKYFYHADSIAHTDQGE